MLRSLIQKYVLILLSAEDRLMHRRPSKQQHTAVLGNLSGMLSVNQAQLKTKLRSVCEVGLYDRKLNNRSHEYISVTLSQRSEDLIHFGWFMC